MVKPTESTYRNRSIAENSSSFKKNSIESAMKGSRVGDQKSSMEGVYKVSRKLAISADDSHGTEDLRHLKGTTSISQSSIVSRKNDQWNVKRDIPVGTVRNNPFVPEPKHQPPSPQLMYQKKQWDTSDIPKGSVAARIQETKSLRNNVGGNKPVSPSPLKMIGGTNSRTTTFSKTSSSPNKPFKSTTSSPRNSPRGFYPKVGSSSWTKHQPPQHHQEEQNGSTTNKRWEPSREIPNGTVKGRLSSLYGKNEMVVRKPKDISPVVTTGVIKNSFDSPIEVATEYNTAIAEDEKSNNDDDQWIIPERNAANTQVFADDWGEAIPAKSAESDDWDTPAKEWIRAGESQTVASSCDETKEKVTDQQNTSLPVEIAATVPHQSFMKTEDVQKIVDHKFARATKTVPSILAPPPKDATTYHKPKEKSFAIQTSRDEDQSLNAESHSFPNVFHDNFVNPTTSSKIMSNKKSTVNLRASTHKDADQQLLNGNSDAFGFPMTSSPKIIENHNMGEIVGGDEFFDASTLPNGYGKPTNGNDMYDSNRFPPLTDVISAEDEGSDNVIKESNSMKGEAKKKRKGFLKGLFGRKSKEIGTKAKQPLSMKDSKKLHTREEGSYSKSSLSDSVNNPSLETGFQDSDIPQSYEEGRREGNKSVPVGNDFVDSSRMEQFQANPKMNTDMNKTIEFNEPTADSFGALKGKNPEKKTVMNMKSTDEFKDTFSTAKNVFNKSKSPTLQAVVSDVNNFKVSKITGDDVFDNLEPDTSLSQTSQKKSVSETFLDPDLDHLDSNIDSDEGSNEHTSVPKNISTTVVPPHLVPAQKEENSSQHICQGLDDGKESPSSSPWKAQQDSKKRTLKNDGDEVLLRTKKSPSKINSEVNELINSSDREEVISDIPMKSSLQSRKNPPIDPSSYSRHKLSRNSRNSYHTKEKMFGSGSNNRAGEGDHHRINGAKFARAAHAYNNIVKKNTSEDSEEQRRYMTIQAVSTSASDISCSSTYESYQRKLAHSLKKANIVTKNSSDYSLHSHRSMDDSSIESDVRVLRTMLRRPRLDNDNEKVIMVSRQIEGFPTYDADSATDPMQRVGLRLLSSAIIPIQTEVRRFLAMRHALTRMWALIVIQTYTRRFLAQKNYKKSMSSVITIQSVLRGHLARNDVIDKHICAIEIQRYVRGYLATMQVYEDIYKVTLVQSLVRMRIAMDYAAYRMSLVIQLQSIARGFLVRRRRTHLDKHATLIQSSWRCFYNRLTYQFDLLDIIIVQSLWRKKLGMRVAAGKMEEKQKESATKIQSVVRMYLCRSDYLDYRAATKIQSIGRMYFCRTKYTDYKENLAAIIIQAKWRSYDCKLNFLHFLADVLIVQSTIRRFLAQRKVKAMKNAAALKIQSAWRGLICYIDYHEHLTVRRIQSAWRGYVCRRNYEREKAAIRIQSSWRGFLYYADYMFELSDIVVVQKQIRVWLAKRAAKRRQVDKRHQHASTIIQAYWRRYWCFSNFIIALDCSIQIQAQVRRFLQQKHDLTQKIAAMSIQTAWRHAQAKKLTYQTDVIRQITDSSRQMSKKQSTAAIDIQRVFRGSLCRNALQVHLAAVLIQSHVRGKQARVAVGLYIAVRKIQAAWRAFAPRQRYVTYISARRIQSAWRRRAPRQIYVTFIAARCIQNGWRCKKANQDVSLLRREFNAAALIQSTWRGFVCYTDFVFTLSDIVAVQRIARGYLSRKKYGGTIRSKVSHKMKEFHAAVAIQRISRGFQARQNYWYTLGCTMQIQSWWRGRLVLLKIERKAEALLTLQCFVRCCLARQEYMQRRFVFMLIQTAELERSKKLKAQKAKEQVRLDKAARVIQRFFLGVNQDIDELVRATKKRKNWRKTMKREKCSGEVEEEELLLEKVWSGLISHSRDEEPFTRHYTNLGHVSSSKMRKNIAGDFNQVAEAKMVTSPHPTSSIRMIRKDDAIDMDDDFQLEEAFIDAKIYNAKERRSYKGNNRSIRAHPRIVSSKNATGSNRKSKGIGGTGNFKNKISVM